MVVPDSSVLVAGAERSHQCFEVADEALARVRERGSVIAHTLAECYARLTSRPFDWTVRAASEYLDSLVVRPPVGLDPGRYPAALAELGHHDILGGSVYDGLIAISAREAGATLLSLDLRARRTYETVGVEFELLGGR